MELLEIKDPSFLKPYNYNELEQLAKEIRSFLIHSVSKTGGHLSSNLGVVELTIALHYVFNSPEDKFIFDVGHQSYIHKILTGRAKDFYTLRQWNGLAGFQKRSESEHDPWEAGHSSTSLSAALGMAMARDLNKENYHVIPIIGDGAMTGGMSYEALNQIGALKKNVIIVFNDNDMSISKNVGAISHGFDKLRSSKPYTNMKQEVKEVLSSNSIGETVLGGLKSVRDVLKRNIVDSSIFDELGIEYFGPVDGHNFKELIRVLNVAKKHEGPVVVHVITKKGKGYSYCEEDRDGYWHGVSSFNPETGLIKSMLPVGHLSWSEVVSETLIRLAKKDKEIVVLTPAMMTGSKLERYASLYPNRFFDCGIAEEHAATLAGALAQSKKKPFLAIYSSFLQRAYDQINHDVTRMDLPVVLGIDRSGIVGEDGDTHQGVFDIGILRPLPNMIIAQPKDGNEAQHLIYTAFHQQHPFAIRYPRGTVAYQEVGDFKEIPVGTWSVFESEQPNKAILITYGPDVDRFIQKIEINQYPITVVNARFLKPLDTEVLDVLVARNIPIFTYEGEMLAGGLSSAILEYLNDSNKEAHIRRIGIDDVYIPHGSVQEIRKNYSLDLPSVIKSILAEIGGEYED